MTVKTSAPGKLLLMGEHAVVYGYPCIVAAVDKRIYIEAKWSDNNKDKVIAPGVKNTVFIDMAIKVMKEKYDITQESELKTLSDFPPNIGLGSSSASTVAAVKALATLFNITLSQSQLFNLVHTIILKIQKKGSGADVAASVYGGVVYFKSGLIAKINIPSSFSLIIGYSGSKADTVSYIKKVSQLYTERRKEIDKLFDQIGALVEKAKKALESNDMPTLGTLMTQNHQLLQKLNVSTPQLDAMVEASLTAGAWGAKLSGAGGGDCMIALVSESKRDKVRYAIEKAGGRIINVSVDKRGVR